MRMTPNQLRQTTPFIVMSLRMKRRCQWQYQLRRRKRIHPLTLWSLSVWAPRLTPCRCTSIHASLNSAHTSDAKAPAVPLTSPATHQCAPREVRCQDSAQSICPNQPGRYLPFVRSGSDTEIFILSCWVDTIFLSFYCLVNRVPCTEAKSHFSGYTEQIKFLL